MASCNLNYSGSTGVINADAYVYEQTTSGTSRRVRVVLQVYSIDYSGARDGGYSVYCKQSGTNVSVPVYNGFTISGSAQTIFDKTFSVSVAKGSDSADIDLSFSASLVSPSSGTKTISGSITQLYLTKEPDAPDAEPSWITLSANRVQMGKNLLISINADSQDCYHELTCRIREDKEELLWEGKGTSYAWTVPDMADQCPDALEMTVSIICYTSLNGKRLGQDAKELVITVPDATTPSVEGGELTMGQEGKVLCPRNSQFFTQKLELEFYGTTALIAEGQIESAQWTPGYDLAALIPSLTYGTGTLKCTTMNGTAVVGTKTATIRLHVPDNDVTRPKFTAEGLTLKPYLPWLDDNIYIRGKCGVQADMEASSDYSRIVSYQLTVGSTTVEGNPAVIGTLVSEGNVRVVARVIDARGYSTAVTTYIDVLPYKRPRITPYPGYSDIICERALENGELNSKGTYLAIRAGVEYTSILKDGEDLNLCWLAYRWRPGNGGSFSQWETLLDPTDGTKASVLIGNIVSSLETSYVVELVAYDMLEEAHFMTFQIMTEAVSFVLYDGEDGAGFGKYPEAPHVVDIASHMTLIVRGGMQVLGETWQDLGLGKNVTTCPYEVGHTPQSGCRYLVSNGNHVYVAFDCLLNPGHEFWIVNQTAIPEAFCPKRDVGAICMTDTGIAQVSVNQNGTVFVNGVMNLLTESTSEISVDGYIDYWI